MSQDGNLLVNAKILPNPLMLHGSLLLNDKILPNPLMALAVIKGNLKLR